MDRLDTKQKAFKINLDSTIYGSFAEIGAGQEVARNFFRAGGAAGTVAKTMSAYDMKFSDDIYGKEKSGRYVCEERLTKMISHEYDLVVERLQERSENSRFFAFADTAAAKSYRGKGENHAWLGLRFQHTPGSKESDVVLHIKMFDNENVQQQEAIGIIGVNLVFACYYYHDNREAFIRSLMDNISTDRIEIDMIRISGDAFSHQDSRLFSLELVKNNFCQAVMFDSDGRVIEAANALYKKNILLCRGSYRPPTLVNMDMLEKGLKHFKKDLGKRKDQSVKDVLVLPEISMNKLRDRENTVDNEDFLARIILLNQLGHSVLISNYQTYGDLNEFVSTYNRGAIGFMMGYYNLFEIFNRNSYENEKAGFLGGIAKLLGKKTKLYVYPGMDDDGKKVLSYNDFSVEDGDKHLLTYLEAESRIESIEDFNQDVLHIWSRVVLKMIVEGKPGWEKMVPQIVAKAVNEKCLFGAKCEI